MRDATDATPRFRSCVDDGDAQRLVHFLCAEHLVARPRPEAPLGGCIDAVETVLSGRRGSLTRGAFSSSRPVIESPITRSHLLASQARPENSRVCVHIVLGEFPESEPPGRPGWVRCPLVPPEYDWRGLPRSSAPCDSDRLRRTDWHTPRRCYVASLFTPGSRPRRKPPGNP